MAPASFAIFTASNVAVLAGSSVSESEPTWKIFVSVSISLFISSMESLVSAPGFLAKENPLSPVIERLTNARVVNAEGSVIKPLVSIGTPSNVLLKKSPCISAPIFPINAVLRPDLDTAVSILAGAPPGFCSKSFIPAGERPAGVKSIKSSPNATTSQFFIT